MCVIDLYAVWLFSSEDTKTLVIPNGLLYLQKNQVLLPSILKAEAFVRCKYNKCKLLLVVQNAMRKSYDLTLHEAVLSKTFFCAEQHKSNRITRIFSVAYTLQFWSECKHMNSPPWQFYLGYSQTEIFLGNFQM